MPDTEFSYAPPQQMYELMVRVSERGWTDELHYRAGEIYERLGDFAATAEHWQAVQIPDHLLLQRLSLLYIKMERWQDAIAQLEQLLHIETNNAWANFQYGLLIAPVNPSDALDHLARAGDIHVEFTTTLKDVLLKEAQNTYISKAVGKIMLQYRYWGQAEHAFWHAAVISNSDPDSMAYLAFARQRQGKSGEMWMNAALESGHDLVQVHSIHGLYLRDRRNYVGSRDAFARAIQLDSGHPALYAELGTAYRLMGDLQKAEYWLRYAVDLSGSALEFQEILATFYAEEGTNFTPASLEALQDVADTLPLDPQLLAGFGWAIYTMGDTETGKQQIDAALQLIPDHPAGRYYQARVLMNEGQKEAAIAMMREIAKSDSSYAQLAEEFAKEWQTQKQMPP